MAREQTGHPVLLDARGVLAHEELLQRHRGLQVVARELHVLHAVEIGLELVVAAVLRLQQLRADGRALAHDIAEVRAAVGGRADRRNRGADLQQLAFLHLLSPVARGGVHDLVAEHRSQFRLVLQLDQQAAVDRDLAARQRPGIQLAAVQHHELVGQRSVGDGCEPIAHLLHVLRDARIGDVVAALRLPRGTVVLLSELDLLALGDHLDLLAAGDRVRRAARERGGEQDGGEQAAHGGIPRR